MIIRARVVVTMDGPPIENGAVVVSDDRIEDVGKFPEVSKRYSAQEVVDLGEQALLPGLVNAHCHLDYTCLRGKIPRQKSFTDWIRAINAEKAKISAEEYVASINQGFAEAKRLELLQISGSTSKRSMRAATPKLPTPAEFSTRTTDAWQQTQRLSPKVSSAGSTSTNSNSAPSAMAELVYKNTPAELRSRVVAVSCTLPSLALIVTGNRTGTRARERLSFFCWVMARGATRLSRNDSRCQNLEGLLV